MGLGFFRALKGERERGDHVKNPAYSGQFNGILDAVGQAVLKPNGFKNRGRLFNRVTIDNLIQVVELADKLGIVLDV
jgi:hypothetical protein